MPITDPSFPALHGRPARGWVNDPNGCAYVDGTYHVFFQYNPDGPVHHRIQWGHATSTDLVRWTEQPVAFGPRDGGPDAFGCWSGVMGFDGGTPTAFYTGIRGAPADSRVLTATSDSAMIEWVQSEVPVAGMPDEPGLTEVRDPFLFSFEGRDYAIQGSGYTDGTPVILLYRCHTRTDWEYLGPLVTGGSGVAAAHAPAHIWECPQLFRVDGQWVLVVSLWSRHDAGHHLGGVAYLAGELSEGGVGLKFLPASGGPVDAGPDFYAPQVLAASLSEPRTLMWAWTWDESRPAADVDAAGWCGALTYARSLSYRDGELRSEPVSEVSSLRSGVLFRGAGSFAVPAAARAFEVSADGPVQLVVVDGAACTVVAAVSSGRILVDGSVVEVFGSESVPRTLHAYPTATSRFEVRALGECTVHELAL
ncbi:glycoside hydrolase family 32 protein [Specibacter cremeus]|uniref:glycoside hydrolase family 32 protein n=1 Tax=Specibacter cremeus TaxID=1629051 RepID=UPI0013DDC945|nr:glycoside hydrolase family 32 protein [Specibacter cremeus]